MRNFPITLKEHKIPLHFENCAGVAWRINIFPNRQSAHALLVSIVCVSKKIGQHVSIGIERDWLL